MTWLEGLPLQGTAAIVAVLSGVLTAAVLTVSRRSPVRWAVTLAGPVIVAVGFYSLPTLTEATPSDNGSWPGLLIGIWSAAGVATSLLVTSVWTLLTTREHE
jgi:hypothetical protein